MAIFDSLINEVAQKFGLGDKAGGLLAGLLSLVTNTESGGITGFISKFTSAGLGNVVDSWIGRGENTAITSDQLSSVLGNDTIRNLADQVGIAPAAATPALAFMLPKVVDGLTPDGVVPTSLPDTIMNYISGLGGLLGKGVGAVTGAAGAVTGAAGDVIGGAADMAGKGISAAGDLASGAAGAVGAGAAALGAGVAGAAGAVGSGAKAAAGAVGSGAKAAAEIAGETAQSGMSGLLRLLPLLLLALVAFLGYRYCAGSGLDSQTATTASPAPSVAAAAPSATATPIPTPTGPLNPEAAVKAAAEAASSALATLKPGNAEELVKALNLQIINFASGSNGIPKENEELLKKSAEAIKAAPAGIKLEVGGHTDSLGNAAGNKTLSQKRADAVKAYLVKQGVAADMLVSKGYGPDKPVADNTTKEGQFKNRRIEFSVVK